MEDLKAKDPYLEGKKIVVALSGGIDSVVLLHYLHYHYADNLRAIHCNHNLSGYAQDWQIFCQNLCQELGVEFSLINLDVDGSSNVENNARVARYKSLSCSLNNAEVICTAHHKNDQAETLLLQLFRGSGVAGLASMPKEKNLGKGIHYRPFLNIEKSKIIDYAKKHKLNWIEDDSNKNIDFKRNYLRLETIPKLEKEFKNLINSISRSAKHQSEALKLSRDLADVDIAHNDVIAQSGRIRVSGLIALEEYRIKNILRHHLNLLNFQLPSDKVLQQIVEMLSAKTDSNPVVSWGAFEIRRFKGELYFVNNTEEKVENFCEFYEEFKNLPNFSIRYRQDGQRVKITGKNHSQSLKKLLQEAGIPPWERNSLRMYYIDDELRAVERLGHMQED